jgi:hypothetical protein
MTLAVSAEQLAIQLCRTVQVADFNGDPEQLRDAPDLLGGG